MNTIVVKYITLSLKIKGLTANIKKGIIKKMKTIPDCHEYVDFKLCD